MHQLQRRYKQELVRAPLHQNRRRHWCVPCFASFRRVLRTHIAAQLVCRRSYLRQTTEGLTIQKMLSIAASFANPKPVQVYRYGPAVCVGLVLPKLAWDFYVLRYSKLTCEDDEDDIKDPTRVAAVNACIRAVKQTREIWIVVEKHCSKIAIDSKLVELLLTEVDEFLASEAVSDDDASEVDDDSDSDDGASDDDDGSAKGDLEFLIQWETTILNYVSPLFGLLAAKADDSKAEETIREKLKCLAWLMVTFHSEIRLQRSRVALRDYVEADQLHRDAAEHEDKDKQALLTDQKNRKLDKLRRLYPRNPHDQEVFFWPFVDPLSIPNPERDHVESWYGSWGHYSGKTFGVEDGLKAQLLLLEEEFVPSRHPGAYSAILIETQWKKQIWCHTVTDLYLPLSAFWILPYIRWMLSTRSEGYGYVNDCSVS
jgi:hypothetical protein